MYSTICVKRASFLLLLWFRAMFLLHRSLATAEPGNRSVKCLATAGAG